MTRLCLALALLLTSSACAMQSGNVPPEEERSDTQSTVAIPKAAIVAAPQGPARTCPAAAGASRREQVCWRWRCAGDATAEAQWDGDAGSCRAADIDPSAAERALQRINVHRFIAEVSPVVVEPGWTVAGQQCALIAHANAKLSHTPPPAWQCWSEKGAATSAVSLVANRSAVRSIAAYFEDPGNETTMVHRRWLLDEALTTVGFGSTNRYSCVVLDGRAVGGAPAIVRAPGRGWAAWPPAGPVPVDVFTDEKIDVSGWTIQSAADDLEAATVTVTEDGEARSITVTHLTASLGSRSAIRFVPVGWKTQAGHSYVVKAGAIEYTVEPTDCDADAAETTSASPLTTQK